MINRLTRINKSKYYKTFFSEHKTNSKRTWKAVRSLINIEIKSKKQILSLNIKNQIETNPRTISEAFNKFFSTIPKDIDNKIIPTNKTHKDYLNASIVNSFFLTPTNDEEVKSLIKEMNTSKSVGPYSIPTNILKLSSPVLSKPLVKLINFSISEGTFPELLKFANVIPVFKKGDNLDIPISLISNIGKLIEKIVHKRFYNFLKKNSLLFEQQYGFRNKMSTNHALIDITNRIQEACDSGQYACGIYVDFKKAFDTVNHNILLDKLAYYGVRGTENKWFKTYLTNRKQHVTVSDQTSDNALIEFGIPQGSVLGPLLFLIYINDLNQAIKFRREHHFADDTNLLLVDNSLNKINKHINHDLKLLTTWLRANKTSLNTSKTEILLFRPKSKRNITKHLNFRISGQYIPRTTQVKYLGLTMNEHLDLDLYFSQLKKKLNRGIGLLSKIRHFTPKHLLKTLYFSLFNSNLIYGCQIWGQDQNEEFTKNFKKKQ